MGELSAVSGAAKWIASSLIEEAKYLYGVKDHVRSLQRDLECMKELLQRVDEDPRLQREDGQVCVFTETIRDLAFRAEDAIDTYVVDVRSRICLVSDSYRIHTLRKEIDAIRQEIREAKERFDTFNTILPTTSPVGPSQSRPIPENYIHLEGEVVVGIDNVISQLANRLTNPEDDFKVVGIVGTGGGGKTTLATQLYRHSKVASWFTHKAFVSISQQWSRSDLFDRIFKQVKGEDCMVPSSEGEIVKELQHFLKDKQCLVVLDDIWEKKAWDDIYPIFPLSNKGCRVLLTTRHQEVALHTHNKCIIHKPKLLTEDQKWELFTKVAVAGRAGIENNAEFENLGKQMLEKCEGLPLAVVTLAGILRTKQALYQWEEISKACTPNILKGKGSPSYGVVKDMLELSYLDLPARLKQCLLYLVCFPEDWEIEDDILFRLWIAEGFIKDGMLVEQGTLEDAARKVLDELAQRCILQVICRNAQGKIRLFRLHDLMRELCIEYAKASRFFEMINASTNVPDGGGSSQPRRIAIFSRDVAAKNHQLRTLVHQLRTPDIVSKKLEPVHEMFKLLRVLHIEGEKIVGLPEQIGDLIHLRYLGILHTQITKLPKSVIKLRNLLYLQCLKFAEQVEVPNGLVCKMENLRELVLPLSMKRGSSFKTLGLSGSKNLLTLSGGAGKWVTKDLPTLSCTVQHLHIYDIQEMSEIEAIYGCPSIVKDRLSSLGCHNGSSGVVHVEFDIWKLSHCTTLQHLNLGCQLTISCTGTIPHFPRNLVYMSLYDSRIERDDLIEAIGKLPKLKSLRLLRDAYFGTQLSCILGSAFPQLQELELCDLTKLEEWRLEEGDMPCLRKIKIQSCVELKRLPERISSITTLKELYISWMPQEFYKRLEHGESRVGEDSYIIQHIPTTKFEYIYIT